MQIVAIDVISQLLLHGCKFSSKVFLWMERCKNEFWVFLNRQTNAFVLATGKLVGDIFNLVSWGIFLWSQSLLCIGKSFVANLVYEWHPGILHSPLSWTNLASWHETMEPKVITLNEHFLQCLASEVCGQSRRNKVWKVGSCNLWKFLPYPIAYMWKKLSRGFPQFDSDPKNFPHITSNRIRKLKEMFLKYQFKKPANFD